MSMHKSLKSKDTLVRRRNVLTRSERIDRLREDEKWEANASVFALPKVKPVVITAPSAPPKAAAEAPAEGEGEAAGEEAAEPAADE